MTAPAPASIGLRDVLAARLGLSMPSLSDDRLGKTLATAQTALAESSDAAALATLARKPLDSDVWQTVIDAVTIHETHFFRQKDWFEEFERQVLVPLIDERARRGQRTIRIWSAGCASGEEPYTLAMMLDRLLPDRQRWTVEILGTDISASTLAAARAATYRKWALRELGPRERKAYFSKIESGRYQLASAIRDMVSFRLMNLADPASAMWPAPGSFDIVFCRNVLIYWTGDVQRLIAEALCQRVAPGGWLVVSPAEAVAEWYRPLQPHNFQNAIFFRQAAPGDKAARPAKTTALPPRTPAQARAPRLPAKAPRAQPLSPLSGAQNGGAQNDGTPIAGTHIAGAQAFADQGLLGQARAASEALIASDALHGDAYLLLASICEELGDLPAAFEAARRAVYLMSDSALAHFRLGAVLRAMGSAAQAQRSFMTVLELLRPQPDDAPAGAEGDITVGVLRYAVNSYLTDADHG
jgi:chemotaxis protein methyltransferase CheR